MAAAIAESVPAAEVELVRGGRGDFIVTADGRSLWDKRRTHGEEFPAHDRILAALRG